MRNIVLPACLLLCSVTATVAASPLYFTAAEWAQPRNGAAMVRHPALAAAMQQVGEGKLQLLYPGGDEGSLWAAELQAWLVALGLASERIELLPGSSRADAIEIRVVAPAATE